MLKLVRIYILLLSLLFPLSTSAQFFVTGDDPGRVKWSVIESDNFKVIYPRGNDSLALVYGQNLERFRIPISRSMRYIPCGPDNPLNRKMEIVLHSYYGNNGSVAWAPKRMDLYTIPGAYDPDPTPWNVQLAVHELRHVSQMQFGLTGFFKPGNYIFGQMWEGLAVILYPGATFMEGDAVMTETALTKSGRGRISDFLNYYRVAFDNGDYRKWGHWRFASQRDYSPNHYALGYLCMGGTRYLHGSPTLFGDAMHMATKKPLRFGATYDKIEEASGKKFMKAFMEVCDSLGQLWKEEADARAPYIDSRQFCAEPKIYTNYSSLIFSGDKMYAVKEGFRNSPVLVKIDSMGKERIVSQMAAQRSEIRTDEKGRLWWSENTTDERWTLETGSIIRRRDGKTVTIGKRGLKYNPVPAPSGTRFSVSEYTIGGRTRLDILDGFGKIQKSFDAPDSLQIVQTAWTSDEDVYASAISENGYGIYHINLYEGVWRNTLDPQPVMIRNLRSYNGEIMFTSDRTGVNELYHLDPKTGRLKQKTAIRHGGNNFCYSPDGKYLYYTSLTMKGNQIFRTAVEDLIDRDTDFTTYHKYAIAEALTRQEKELAAQAGEELFPADSVSSFSKAKKYHKFPNAFNIHSWAPVYVSVDNIMNMSFDRFYQALSLGATGIIQNDLSTSVGEFGYSAHKDHYNPEKWRHSGHIKYTYSGLYPIFEVDLDFNDRALRQYNVTTYKLEEGGGYISLTSRELSAPNFQGKLSTYIPFKFSKGGWYSGFIPKLSYTFTNDRFNTSLVNMSYENGGIRNEPTFIGSSKGKNILRQYLSGSVRGYTMLSTPNSAVYPRWGVGVELGASGNLGLEKYISPMGYAYVYGYIPGVTREQGIKFTALHQSKLSSESIFGQAVVNVLPRGLQKQSDILSSLSVKNPHMTKFSMDYAVPIFIGNLVLGKNIFAIKRLVVTPSFDCTLLGKKAELWSANLDLVFDFESIVTLEFPVSIGVTGSYNGGFNGSFEALKINDRFFVGPVFNVVF